MQPRLLIAIVIACLAGASPATAKETRCGWYMNPTPGNLMLGDKDGVWWITAQGQGEGLRAEGADENLPDFNPKQFVKTQPNGYGYGCACLSVETDAQDMKITRVYSGKILPLAKCRKDASLPDPND